MSKSARQLPLLIALIAVALLVTLLRNFLVGTGYKPGDVPPYPVFVLSEDSGDLLVVEHSQNEIIRIDHNTQKATVIAGNGSSDFSGDGGSATKAGLFLMGIAKDKLGNLYIADHNHHRIRKIDADGNISTIAGTGEAGFSGDGGAATQAQVNDPAGVAVDALGNVWIADTYNNRIRKIDSSGIISTVAGTGEAGFSGDGGSGNKAKLDFPWAVAVGSNGKVLITDTANNRIRVLDTQGMISTLVGNGQEGFAGDGGSALQAKLDRPQMALTDAQGNLYIADTNNDRIRKVDDKGTISTVAGGGKAESAEIAAQIQLNGPFNLSIDGDGNFYIADTGNFRLLKVSTLGKVVPFKLGN
jgi:trimeric autotransporter adhesin